MKTSFALQRPSYLCVGVYIEILRAFLYLKQHRREFR
jgi:hypothetical protein